MKKPILLFFLILLAHTVAAATVWNPAGNGIVPPETGDWQVAANWTMGVPVIAGDSGREKAVFSMPGAAECVVRGAQSVECLAQGDNGPGGVIRVVDGGDLTTGTNWSAIGYNHAASMVVEPGGTVNCGGHMWVGFSAGGGGVLELNGGTVNVAGMFGLGWDGGVGHVILNEGVLNLTDIHPTDSIRSDSVLDVRAGILVLDGDRQATVEDYLEDNRITAFGGNGVLHWDYSETRTDKTTVWAEPASSEGTGDVNGDSVVDREDLMLLSAQWLQLLPGATADFTGDQRVDLADYSVLAARWGPSEAPYFPTLHDTVMCGYQGWFTCPGDGSRRGWVHWGKSGRFEPGYCSVDMWPDMTEYESDERYATAFRHTDGSVAHVFSSHHPRTVDRHFRWMAEYGIDGVFLQRFAVETYAAKNRNHCDTVLQNCRQAANTHKRAYAIMYDLSGLAEGGTQQVIDDWKHLVDDLGVGRDPDDRSYLYHNGKPVLAVWGMCFRDRDYTLDECEALLDFLKEDPQYGGFTVMLGVPSYWRTLGADCVVDSRVYDIIKKADIISPWAVGRFGSIHESELDSYAGNVWLKDVDWCKARQIEYMPVVFPGFSWHNLQGWGWDQIPRRGGTFLWRQFRTAVNEARASMIYVAMFDEVDEGTAIFKCTNNPPGGGTPFLPTGNEQYLPKYPADALLPSDHYLWLVGEVAGKIHERLPIPETMPSR